ncbi:hypothetical protein [Serratia sp. 14-2641]|uniref:hypothetical protein n=1 Tax=Serratia sp. 14-2641 TaxID=1841657 RepID=UPI00080FA0CB|nr:hypothetical protein [Serratia sp. 14-2641]OCJ30598.1 hypothetical protein A6U95_06780 [Serratia sp. 14-2641]
MDKQTESRSQFEAEFKRRHGDIPESRMSALLRIHNFGTDEDPELDYYSLRARDAWEWWQKGRESLVVELPDYADVNSAKSFAGRAMLTGKNSAITKFSESLRAIGIRIKGEGV